MADNIVIPKDARKKSLDAKRINYLNGLKIRLFKNNYTPVVGSVLADFDEATFDGYLWKALNSFGVVFLNVTNNAETDSAVLTWTATGGVIANDVYGWYTEDTDGKVGPCARFDPGPIRIDAAGKAVSVHIFFEDGGLAP